MPDISDKILALTLMALPFLFAVTMREALRGYVAHKMGDWTVKSSGRLTANPLVHADPVWTGLVPVLVFLFTPIPILFGQAKPIDINANNFTDVRKGVLYASLAGPASLFLMAIAWAYVMRFSTGFGMDGNDWLPNTAFMGIQLSCIFLVIGMLPIPGLDGGRILEHFLPPQAAESFRAIEPYGFFIVIGIFIFLRPVILVPSFFLIDLVRSLVGV